MKWFNVRIIFQRELRDQLRDRRTLFTIAVLPLLLYPLLGMIFLQMSQFKREQPTRVWIIGSRGLPQSPALIDDESFVAKFCPPKESRLLELDLEPDPPAQVRETDDRSASVGSSAKSLAELRRLAQARIRSGQYDAVLYFPADFADNLARYRESLGGGSGPAAGDGPSGNVPGPQLFINAASDRSRMALQRVQVVLDRWRDEVIRQNLAENKVPLAATQPFQVVDADVSEEVSRRAALWSKILPFVVLVWALTGAFYPAIDLCAGEKERGTLETLLSSPAQRGEIVWGKLLTVMTFSMATSLLNLASMGLTGLFIIKQIGGMGIAAATFKLGPPPISSVGWLVLAMIPIAALFSALSLAIAAFARSSKEGQYYLMPLLLITLPLMMLPMLPATELDLGTSLIPITGVMLLLRAAIEGQYVEALRYLIPVTLVMGVCCLFAIRWAVSQFNNESVLFRESERWGLKLWVRHLVRDRDDTPTMGEAVLCGLLLLVIVFFARLNAAPPSSWSQILSGAVITQIALIATPALLMAIMLTRSIKQTLLLRLPTNKAAIPAALLLAVFLHPSVMYMHEFIHQLYPMNDEVLQALKPFEELLLGQSLVWILLAFALLPAICEELAFRGFILSGLRQMQRKWPAILLSSIFFGMTHGMLQQSLAACMLGMVIGFIAVQTGSLIPAIVFHFSHNSLTIISQRVGPEMFQGHPVLGWILQPLQSGQIGYQPSYAIISAAIAVGILMWLRRLTNSRFESCARQPCDETQALQVVAGQ